MNRFQLIIVTFLTLLAHQCHYVMDPGIDSLYFCDQYKNEKCLIRFNEKTRIYKPQIPESKTGSWYDLGYYMYFHTRETPGLKIDFTRNLTKNELKLLKQSLNCKISIQKGPIIYENEMEGLRIDRSGFWCFDYLGSHLVDFMKSQKAEKQTPKMDYFPITLSIEFSSKLERIHGKKSTLIYIKWES